MYIKLESNYVKFLIPKFLSYRTTFNFLLIPWLLLTNLNTFQLNSATSETINPSQSNPTLFGKWVHNKVTEIYRSDLDLSMIAAQLNSLFSLKSISLYRISDQKIAAFVTYNEPVLKIHLGLFFPISKEGFIYTVHDSESTARLPELVLSNTKLPATTFIPPGARLAIPDFNNPIKDATRLAEMLHKNNYEFMRIKFDKFIGFTVELNNKINVRFGIEPFERQFIKLNDTLNQILKRNIDVSGIELDYSGKVVVRKI